MKLQHPSSFGRFPLQFRDRFYLLFARRLSSSDSGMRLNLAASFRPKHTVVFDGTRWIPLTLKDGVTCK